jgi:hypothetical protein
MFQIVHRREMILDVGQGQVGLRADEGPSLRDIRGQWPPFVVYEILQMLWRLRPCQHAGRQLSPSGICTHQHAADATRMSSPGFCPHSRPEERLSTRHQRVVIASPGLRGRPCVRQEQADPDEL